MTSLVVDLSNLIHAAKWAILKDKKGFDFPLIFYKVVYDIVKSVHQFQASKIVLAADSPAPWRFKVYPRYKANRQADEYAVQMKEAITVIKGFFQDLTSIPVLAVPEAEADDIIACIVQNTQTPHVIISGDKDFVQLLRPHVRLYAPSLKMERTSEDPDFDLFLKCMRGDPSDFIFAAYPRVRTTKLKEAWTQPDKMLALLETTLPDGIKVKDKYTLNQTLIDLTRQPQEIKTRVLDAVNALKIQPKPCDFFKILKFLGQYKQRTLADFIQVHSDVFKLSYVFR